jgi:hypothetical protein
VPYSDFLSSAETADGERRRRVKKRKKERDKPERRRALCVLVLVGRDMFGLECEIVFKKLAPFY